MEEWFHPYHSDERGEYIKNQILACDALLLGRATYEMLAPYWSSLKNNEMGIADKMNGVSKYVASSTLRKAEWNNSTILKGNAVDEITKLKQLTARDILIPGSAALVHSLVGEHLIDEYQFLVQPHFQGSGKRFFNGAPDVTKLKLVETRTFNLGLVLLRYEPAQN
jgi:dihydrofolate reductase